MSNGILNGANGGKPYRVLVVDDNWADRTWVLLQLSDISPLSQNLIVECTADGQATFDVALKQELALIILDWCLPGLSGAQVLHGLRENGVWAPVVVISDLEREDIEEDLDQLGAAFLNKARLQPDSLLAAIKTAFDLQKEPAAIPMGETVPAVYQTAPNSVAEVAR
jgi:CheY-like chemotaxis protein